MNEHENRHHEDDDRLPEPNQSYGLGRAPSRLTWPVRRFYWFLEKHFLWRISDSFKKITHAFRYRSPIAYIGATMLITLTGVAIGAAVYFHNEAKDAETPVTAEVPLDPETVIATTPAPVPVAPVTPPSQAKADDELKGVVPDFETSSGNSSSDGNSSGNSSSGGGSSSNGNSLPETVVKPAEVPDSPPLRVAHNFAQTFVDYEIGKKGVARDFTRTATPKLSKQLKQDPPRQPSNGDIPKATVLNVVKGDQKGDRMEVSVSLMRSGATSELRLALSQEKKKWLVSEVRG